MMYTFRDYLKLLSNTVFHPSCEKFYPSASAKLIAKTAMLVLWNRRAYLAWVDLDEFALTVVLFTAAFAFIGAAASLAKDKSKGKALISALLGGAAFSAAYFPAAYIVNLTLNKGNHLAISIAIILYSTVLLTMLVITQLRLKKHQ